MTNKYTNVYIKDTYTIGGIYEKNGPLSKYFDKTYDRDLYFGERSFESAEVKLLRDAMSMLIEKTNMKEEDISLIISGDLENQISASNYALRNFSIPYLGIYSACATSAEGMIIASSFLEKKLAKNIIVSTSSHNAASEKQYRNPNEYGTPKPETATFTATGGAAIMLTSDKTDIKVESSTIGRVIDLGITDVNNMGAVMAPAAADTIYRHLTNLKRDVSYYDLILTGDLGMYGKKILIEYMKKTYNISLGKNYNDTGVMLYDVKKQPVLAGASGPVCSALVNFSYVLNSLKTGKISRVLIVPTGAIFSPTFVFQKYSIPSIAHAISIERVIK